MRELSFSDKDCDLFYKVINSAEKTQINTHNFVRYHSKIYFEKKLYSCINKGMAMIFRVEEKIKYVHGIVVKEGVKRFYFEPNEAAEALEFYNDFNHDEIEVR